jgi:Divergent InlB B-repeat domain/Immunoglobulin domain
MNHKALWAGLSILLLPLFPGGKAGAADYTLTVGIVGSGTVLRNPTNNVYPSGVTVTLTAISNDPIWYFSSWSGDATGTANPLNVKMLSNKAITATFQQLPTYTLTLATNGQGTITLSPAGGVYASNTAVTVTATPAAGWVFIAWSGDATGAANPVSVTMSRNLSLAATFAQLPAFDVQPQNVTNTLGSTVNFTAHAVDSPPLSLQWYFNNGPLPGATSSSLTLTSVAYTNAGNYWIVAINSYGTATSSVGALVLSHVGSTNAVQVCTEAALRAAIAVGGWVSINCNGTFTLSDTINITNNVILDAQNAAVTISGNNAVRLFYVAPGASMAATNLTLANGSVTNHPADGGGIYNDGGTVLLVSCVLTNNNAHIQMAFGGVNVMEGGAIFNQSGSVSLSGCGIFNNTATASNEDSVDAFYGYGGAIYNADGIIRMVGCNCSSNTCQAVPGGMFGPPSGVAFGGAVFQASGTLLVSNCVFALNRALANQSFDYQGGPGYGGALCANGGVVIIDHSQFIGNTSKGGDSKQPTPAFGGAIYSSSTLTVESSIFTGNQALSGDYGGGLYNYVSYGQGGAIYNASSATLNRSSIYSNYVQGSAGSTYGSSPRPGGDGLGGGIFNTGSLMVTNCTVALNSAIAGSGSYYSQLGDVGRADNGNALGGGVYNDANATSFWMNVTIASNFCVANGPEFLGTNGFSAGAQIANTNGVVWLHNSLLAYGGANGNVWGTPVTDAGYNISDDGSAAFASGASYNFTDPRLGPLDYYLGPTPCMALLPDSPAIDTGDNTGAPATDQRGFARPYNGVVDMGAYEFYGTNQVVYLPLLNLAPSGNNLVLSFTVSPPSTYLLQTSTNLLSWEDLETNSPFAGPTTITRTISTQGARQFYRVWFQ